MRHPDGVTRSSPWRLAMAAAALAVVGAACSSPPAPARPAPPPVDLEASASWATSELDPCALLSPDVVDAVEDAGPVYAASPHSCAVGGVADQRIAVAVGTAFGTTERALASPAVVGDRRAYLTRDVPAGPKARCTVDFPISPTRSVRVSAPAGDGDLAASCATATTIAEPIGPKLAAPAERVRAAAPGDLGRWSACDLIGTAPGLAARSQRVREPRRRHLPRQPPGSRLGTVGAGTAVDGARGAARTRRRRAGRPAGRWAGVAGRHPRAVHPHHDRAATAGCAGRRGGAPRHRRGARGRRRPVRDRDDHHGHA